MGQPKHLLHREGKPNYLYIADLLNSIGLETHISCNQMQEGSLGGGHPMIVDQYDGIGPIGGIASAFDKEPKTSWLVVACDLFGLHKSALLKLVEMNDAQAEIVTFQKSGTPFMETTCSIYQPACTEVLRKLLRSKEYGLQKLLKRCRVKTIEVSSTDFLRNVNTRSDYLNS